MQWNIYYSLIYNDRKEEFENNVSMLEYLASFWNAEAVKKIKEARDSREQHTFLDDNKFEDFVTSDKFKDNPLIEAVKKLKESDNVSIIKNDKHPRSKLPTDLSSIKTTLRKFNT